MFYVPEYGIIIMHFAGTVLAYFGALALIIGFTLAVAGAISTRGRLYVGLSVGGCGALVAGGVLNEAYRSVALMVAALWIGFMLGRWRSRHAVRH